MQIVIDIPEGLKNNLSKIQNGSIASKVILNAVANGIPLPKGHGDLIDRQSLLKSTLCKTFGLRSVDIENAPTIIEGSDDE